MANRRLFPTQPAAAVSIAVFRGEEVLLASRTRPPYAGFFTLPGGLVEIGETLEAAALRELREETGVLARLVSFNQPWQFIDRDAFGRVERHYIILSFAAVWLAGEAQIGPEAGEVLWRRPADMAGLPLTPGVPHIVADAKLLVDRTR